MVIINELNFSDSLGVMYALKESKGLKSIQETYKMLEETDMDLMIEVLRISYNRAHKNNEVDNEHFVDILSENNIGFMKIYDAFSKVTEALLFSGMSPEEITERKNLLMNMQNK